MISRTRNDPALANGIALPVIRWIELDESLASRAAVLAAQHRLRGADAIYATVAISHNCELVSLDHEHLTRLSSVVRTFTPSNALAKINGVLPPP